MEKEAFVSLGLNSPEFHSLFKIWDAAGQPKKLAPTADRINGDDGYLPANIAWRSLGDNARRARFERRNERAGKRLPIGVRLSSSKLGLRYSARIRDNYKTIELGYFDTPEEAAKAYQETKTKLGR